MNILDRRYLLKEFAVETKSYGDFLYIRFLYSLILAVLKPPNKK